MLSTMQLNEHKIEAPTAKEHLPPDLYSRNRVIACAVQKIVTKPALRVLDVGGHNGNLASFFPPETEVRVLDKKPKPSDEIGEYIQADARKIPMSDRNFDVVIASDVLEHVEEGDRFQVIEELLRVSKNCVIFGMPCQNNLVEKAEEYIRNQYSKHSGSAHPFLKEHAEMGLPDEQKIEAFLLQKGLNFIKIREGNLMNWYIQQLYGNFQYGEKIAEKRLKFYSYFNEHLSELGNLRPPTYRTIYCIAKEGMLPETEINNELQLHNGWSAETFMELLKIVFDDVRLFIEQRKQQVDYLNDVLNQKDVLLSSTQIDREKILVKARKSIETYRQAILELRNFLAEKEQALIFSKNILEQKERQRGESEQKEKALALELEKQQSSLASLHQQLEQGQSEIHFLRTHIQKNEETLREQQKELKAKQDQIQELRSELKDHQRSLREIMNSRAWKTIMVYSKIKQNVWVKPVQFIKKGWNILITLGPKVFMKRLIRKVKKAPQFSEQQTAYDQYVAKNTLSNQERQDLRKQQEKFVFKPTISIVMPVYNVEEKWLIKAIESVIEQIYPSWELCICDDASTASHIKPLLEKYANLDKRIKITYRQKNGGIVKASNDALKLTTGAYVGLLDNDDELTSNALYEVVKALQETKYDLLYSDEDKLDLEGKRLEPFFKPDWTPDLLLSINYISHFGVYRKKILEQLGGFREGFDGSQDYDLVLRFTEKTQNIKHIPKVLYHWRKIPGSTAAELDAKPYAFVSAKKALEEAIKRRSIAGNITDGIWTGSYRVKRAIKGEPMVSVIIPFKDKVEVLKVCLESIFNKTTYKRYEILLVDNRSELLETQEYLKEIASHEKVKVLHFDEPFNFAAINNFAAKEAKGEYLVLLNNDTEVISADWIESMLEHAQRSEVGIVGAKLLYPNNTVQHAGVLIGVGGIANHAFCRQYRDDHGYFGQIDIVRNYSAVTAACVMISKEVYKKMEGLDAQNLAVGFNDVDFCLRLREKGYLVVYTPYAQLYHYESLSRGFDVNLKEVQYMERRHAGLLKKGDPYYNPNLTRERFDFSLRTGDKLVEG